jgi:hypothetical protein
MPGKQSEPVKPSKTLDSDVRDDRFQQTVRRMLETPPKPHKEAAKKEGGKSRPKSDPKKWT